MGGEVDDEREMGAGRCDGTLMVRRDDDEADEGSQGKVENQGIVSASTNTPKSVIFVISGNPNVLRKMKDVWRIRFRCGHITKGLISQLNRRYIVSAKVRVDVQVSSADSKYKKGCQGRVLIGLDVETQVAKPVLMT